MVGNCDGHQPRAIYRAVCHGIDRCANGRWQIDAVMEVPAISVNARTVGGVHLVWCGGLTHRPDEGRGASGRRSHFGLPRLSRTPCGGRQSMGGPMSNRPRSQSIRVKYAFIKAHRSEFDTAVMCRLFDLSRSGFYAWLRQPLSDRAVEDQRLLGLTRAAYAASHGVYGAPRIFLDLREAGETCSKHRVARIMRVNHIKALHGYRTPRCTRGHTSLLTPNTLQRGFTVQRPNTAWVTDITYVRTWEGWLYLAVVMDLYSRRIVGWSTKPTMARELVLDALLMAVRRRKPKHALILFRSRVAIRQRCVAALLPCASS